MQNTGRLFKRLMAVVGTAVLTGALLLATVVAYAGPSSEHEIIHTGAEGKPITVIVNGQEIQVTATLNVYGEVTVVDANAWQLKASVSDKPASSASQAPDGTDIIASFVITPECLSGSLTEEEMWERASAYNYVFSFDLQTNEFDGMTAYIYIDHHDGTTETLTGVIQDGAVSIVSNISTYCTIAIDVAGGTGGGNANKSGVAPKTGVGLDASQTVACVVGGVALLGACALGLSLKGKRSRR